MCIVDTQPSPELYVIEQQAHAIPWTERVFMLSQGPGYYWRQLVKDDEVKGFMVYQQIADELTLHNIAVRTDERGKGYGRALLNEMLEFARKNRLTVFLEVRQSNTSAIALYNTVGFEVVGRRPGYYRAAEAREDALVMRWQVA